MTKKLLVMAGGTGGHVFPGLAVAEYLQDRGWKILWLGTRERMESQLVPKYGFDIAYIKVSGVRRNGLIRKMSSPFMVTRAVMQARKIIKDFKPDVVLGMGGYASGPGGMAAWFSGIPLVLHEQNAAAGLTNRILSHFAKRICLGFRGAFTGDNVEVVGNPIRREIAALDDFPLENIEGRPVRILVVGGSLGAQVFNERLPGAFARLSNIEVRHQTGRGNLEAVASRYTGLGATYAQAQEFIDDMADAYIWADIVICRAGALTVSEIAAAHKVAVFVPLPSAVDDHQTKNAMSLVKSEAAVLLPQSNFTEDEIVRVLRDLTENPDKITAMAKRVKELAILDATEKVAGICEQLIDD